jgi:hypothetical protein
VVGFVGMPAAKAEAVVKRKNAAKLFFMVNGGELVLGRCLNFSAIARRFIVSGSCR